MGFESFSRRFLSFINWKELLTDTERRKKEGWARSRLYQISLTYLMKRCEKLGKEDIWIDIVSRLPPKRWWTLGLETLTHTATYIHTYPSVRTFHVGIFPWIFLKASSTVGRYFFVTSSPKDRHHQHHHHHQHGRRKDRGFCKRGPTWMEESSRVLLFRGDSTRKRNPDSIAMESTPCHREQMEQLHKYILSISSVLDAATQSQHEHSGIWRQQF